MELIKHLKDRVEGKASKGQRRSSKWRKVRKEFLKKNNKCAICECTTKLEVHHKIPFHVDPSKELDEDNLITLCENKKYGINCHLLMGHLGNYRRHNENIEGDAKKWNQLLK
jgi:5-methylcytosine-specific restriction endonuclease McrA